VGGGQEEKGNGEKSAEIFHGDVSGVTGPLTCESRMVVSVIDTTRSLNG
jgi:hypothetical protein